MTMLQGSRRCLWQELGAAPTNLFLGHRSILHNRQPRVRPRAVLPSVGATSKGPLKIMPKVSKIKDPATFQHSVIMWPVAAFGQCRQRTSPASRSVLHGTVLIRSRLEGSVPLVPLQVTLKTGLSQSPMLTSHTAPSPGLCWVPAPNVWVA